MREVVEEREPHDAPRIRLQPLDLLRHEQGLPEVDFGRDEVVGSRHALQLLVQCPDPPTSLVGIGDAALRDRNQPRREPGP